MSAHKNFVLVLVVVVVVKPPYYQTNRRKFLKSGYTFNSNLRKSFKIKERSHTTRFLHKMSPDSITHNSWLVPFKSEQHHF